MQRDCTLQRHRSSTMQTKCKMLPELDGAAEIKKIRRCFISFPKEPLDCTTQRHGQRTRTKKKALDASSRLQRWTVTRGQGKRGLVEQIFFVALLLRGKTITLTNTRKHKLFTLPSFRDIMARERESFVVVMKRNVTKMCCDTIIPVNCAHMHTLRIQTPHASPVVCKARTEMRFQTNCGPLSIESTRGNTGLRQNRGNESDRKHLKQQQAASRVAEIAGSGLRTCTPLF